MHLKEGSDEASEVSEINVTPFIDVMLVLLIIFMVAAPLATVDIRVDLPASTAKPQPRSDKPLIVSLKANHELFVGDEPLTDRAQLATMLDRVSLGNKDIVIFFQADKTVNYEDLMSVMNSLRKAGYLKIGLVGLEALGDHE